MLDGIGDRVEPVALGSRTVVIATPRLHCDTAAVYRAWDSLGGPTGGTNDLEAAAQRGEGRLQVLHGPWHADGGAP